MRWYVFVPRVDSLEGLDDDATYVCQVWPKVSFSRGCRGAKVSFRISCPVRNSVFLWATIETVITKEMFQ